MLHGRPSPLALLVWNSGGFPARGHFQEVTENRLGGGG